MDRVELLNRPVFICGHPKAGTSLLLNLLDSHKELVVFPEETMFLRRVLPRLERMSQEEWFSFAEQHLIQFFNWNIQNPAPSQFGFETHDYSFISYEHVYSALERTWEFVNSSCDVLGAAVLAYGEVVQHLSDETTRWVEKTPLNEYHADKVFSMWPDAKMLHITRDPRDNFSSYERKHNDWDSQKLARRWRRSTRTGIQNQERFGSERYLMLNYEDLVLNNREMLDRICAFLEIEFEEILCKPTKVGRAWTSNTMFDTTFEQISSIPVGRWKTILSHYDVTVIEVIAANQMKYCGYELEGRWGLLPYLNGIYWRMRQDLYFSLRAGRGERGLN